MANFQQQAAALLQVAVTNARQLLPFQEQCQAPKSICCRRALPFAHLHLGSAAMGSSSSRKAASMDLTGTWVKDKTKSDSMDQAIKLMQLGGLIRQAIKLVRGVEITHTPETFTMAVFSIFAWFKVKETYTLNGTTPSLCKRRDFRRGRHTGTAHERPGKVQLQLSWCDPFSGSGTDDFQLNSPDELSVRSTIKVEGGETSYTTIYNRKKK